MAGGCVISLPSSDSDCDVIIHVPGPNTYTAHGEERICPYHDQVFEVKVWLPENYPFMAPRLVWGDIPVHPNVMEDGTFCMGLESVWKPTMTLAHVGKMLIEFLQVPCVENGTVNDTYLELFQSDLEGFETIAKREGDEGSLGSGGSGE